MRYLLLSLLLAASSLAAQTELTSFAQPAGGPVQPGTANRTVLQFRLYRATGSAAATCTEVRISLLGSATTADWDNIRIYRDADFSGGISAGDPLLASTSVTLAGKAALSGMTEPVQEGFSNGRDYLVVVDVAAAATVGRTFQFRLLPADVIVSAGTVGGGSTGVTSNTHTVKVDSGAEMDVFFAGNPVYATGTSSTNIGQIPPGGGSFNLTIENNGANPLVFTNNPIAAFSGAVSCTPSLGGSPPSSVGAGASIMITVNIAVTLPQAFSFRMDIANNDFDEDPYTMYFHGTAAYEPIMAIEYNASPIADGDNENVGGLTAGVATNLTFTIYNTGNGALNLTGTPLVAFPTQLAVNVSVVSQPATPVAATSGSTTFTLAVTPVGSGNWLFEFAIANNDPYRNPYNIVIEGSSPAVTPSAIRVFTQPAGAYRNNPFTTPAVVAVCNAAGAVDHSNNTVQVTASITPATGDPGATLSGTLTRTAVNGYVNFSDLSINRNGAGYTLTFTHANGSYAPVVSDPFDVVDPPSAPKKKKKKESESSGGCNTGDDQLPGWAALILLLPAALFWRRRAHGAKARATTRS